MAREGLIALVVALVPALVYGVRAAAVRAGLGERLAAWVGAALIGWLAITGALARVGALAVFDSAPPRVLVLAFGALLVLIGVSRAPAFGKLVAAAPLSWPIALQGFRFFVELILWRAALSDDVPVQMTFAGRNFDLITGVTAPLVAWLVARGRIGPRGILAWNLLGVALLANVVGIAVTSFPGPLHQAWPGAPLTEPARFPFVWLPTFLVPLALFLHVVSIRQALAARR